MAKRTGQIRRPPLPTAASNGRAEPIAVIDIGTTAIRMVVAQTTTRGTLRTLDNLQQAVSLGKDVFTRGVIEDTTTEACVKALRSFCQVLEEYRIPLNHGQVRAVATSAVREARNRAEFLDRIYIATGLDVQGVDDAEINRFTYLSVHPVLVAHRRLMKGRTLVIEVGGGSTDLLALYNGRVMFSEGFPLGSLRLRQTLDDSRASAVRLRDIMENEIARTVQQIRANLPGSGRCNAVVMGGDARFAATQFLPDWDRQELAAVPLSPLKALTGRILEMSVDEIVRRYHLTYPEAETLGPALLAYVRLGEILSLRHLDVTSATMRDGVLAEMSAQSAATETFREQIVESALALGRKYRFDQPHAEHVAALCRQLFRALREEHRLAPRYELILTIAALLHETGIYISSRSHHKHSMYLILNSDLFGLGPVDVRLTALVARYHRRAAPLLSHEGYETLDREQRSVVCKLAAILRTADALDRSHTQRIKDVTPTLRKGQLVLTVNGLADVTLEQMALEQKGPMFKQVYGLTVALQKDAADE